MKLQPSSTVYMSMTQYRGKPTPHASLTPSVFPPKQIEKHAYRQSCLLVTFIIFGVSVFSLVEGIAQSAQGLSSGMNKMGFDSQQGQLTFLSNAYTSSVAHPASYSMEATQLLLLL